jgi:NAD(P)-dependent dehydrogenase (short-subunit alcohol dehydrogenase family)
VSSGGRLNGEVAIVTGSGARGTGTAIARLFADEGAAVVVTGRNAESGEAVAEELRGRGGQATFVRAELGARADVEALVAAAVSTHGRLTVLVNNATATIRPDGAIADVADEQWEAALRVNLTGFMYICRAAVPAMLAAGRGSIVNITSRTALRGCPGLSAYTACKGAQEALTRSIAMDYSGRGIRCNSIAPGYIMEKEKFAGDAAFAARAETMQAMHLTRMPTVDDIAHAAVYSAEAK